MSTRSGFTFDAFPTARKSITAQDFMSLSKKDKEDIKSARFVPPKIGSAGFGFFEVEFNSTRYEVTVD